MKIIRILTDSACKIWLWLLLLASSMSHAVTYFEQCDSALKKPSFHLLTQYLDAHNGLLDQEDGDSVPSICFQLNSYKYLVIADIVHTGGANSNDGMFICDFNKKEKSDLNEQCIRSESEEGYGEQPEVMKEFDDDKGKHFVLFDADGPSMGESTKEYEVFYLTTPSAETDGLPYVMQRLFASDNQLKYGLAPHTFSQLRKVDVDDVKEIIDVNTYVDFTDDEYTIGSDDVGDADIQFTYTEEDCHTHKIKHYIREFVFKNGRFQEVKAGSVKIEKQVIAPAASKVQ